VSAATDFGPPGRVDSDAHAVGIVDALVVVAAGVRTRTAAVVDVVAEPR
jgi:hypothetical protein